MERVNRELEASGVADARANFTCALALASPDGAAQSFEGRVFGTLTWPPRGRRGFGYDPIFVPDGYTETFSEMEPELKNRLSHRMRAFEQLMAAAYDDDA
jgi:XTP/dITP diphosphohydrolase